MLRRLSSGETVEGTAFTGAESSLFPGLSVELRKAAR